MHPSETSVLQWQGRFLRILQRGTWEYAERPNVTGIVVIVAVTAEDELLLTEQFRIPVNSQVIELPAGLAGDSSEYAGEDLAQAAARELEEETGYRADRFEVLSAGPPSAGLSNEIITLMRAIGVRQRGAGGGTGDENIVAHKVRLDEVEDWLAAQLAAGTMVDPKVYAGLYFAKRAAGL